MVQEVTQLLDRWQSGDSDALNGVMLLLSDELHQIASRLMFKQQNHTLQATALVNEAFLKLTGHQQLTCADRGHFLSLAARVMRQVLVDHARAKLTAKRQTISEYPDAIDTRDPSQKPLEETLSVDRMLTQLKAFDERASTMLELSYFGGLTYPEIAETLSTSLSTVERELRIAKAWIKSKATC